MSDKQVSRALFDLEKDESRWRRTPHGHVPAGDVLWDEVRSPCGVAVRDRVRDRSVGLHGVARRLQPPREAVDRSIHRSVTAAFAAACGISRARLHGKPAYA
jgi:hypothetical protein